ncbi:sensor histidine kinase [Neoaquamicrobium sediminum]|uniref:Blue-light-activated histidine kinase n=1 Tax=Neoaquamicrobium sediminum TaxID=1849104 RepID=A0ABV3WN38_9HYPH
MWADIWDVVGPQFEQVMQTGEGFSVFDQMLPMVRNGVRHETYWNYSFTAIRGEDGSVVGVFNQGNETTHAVLARRQAEAELERMGNMFAQAPSAVAMLAGPDHVFEVVNAAYEELVGRKDLIGRPVAEVLPEVVTQGFIELLDRVFETGEPFVGRAVSVELSRTPGGPMEERLIDFVYQPLTNVAGLRSGVFVQATDVTHAARAEDALRASEAKYEAMVNAIDQMLWSTRPDGFHDYYNDRWYEYTGMPYGSTDGEAWNGMFHPDDQERAWQVWRQSLATGEPYHIEYRLRHRSGQYRWVIGRAQCVRDTNGEIMRWFGTCTDIHDLKEAEEARQLLLREMNHRVKNLFAIASGMITMTARTAPSVKEMSERLRGRLGALAKAHELIRSAIATDADSSQQSSLRSLVEEVTRPHVEFADGRQLSISGPEVWLGKDASTSLALIFHELATNASKYGALHSHDGAIAIEWVVVADQLELHWKETVADREIHPPTLEGFGSKLANSSATGQLRGEISYDWRASGVHIHFRLPMEQLHR